jgi:DNA mismatch endonuclease (patch repair protein)
VDGCFWHVCPEHAVAPSANGAWWRRKLDTNRSRDRENQEALEDAGWSVVRIWEHEPVDKAVGRVLVAIAAARAAQATRTCSPRIFKEGRAAKSSRYGLAAG